jgi:hypothetical protein
MYWLMIRIRVIEVNCKNFIIWKSSASIEEESDLLIASFGSKS